MENSYYCIHCDRFLQKEQNRFFSYTVCSFTIPEKYIGMIALCSITSYSNTFYIRVDTNNNVINDIYDGTYDSVRQFMRKKIIMSIIAYDVFKDVIKFEDEVIEICAYHYYYMKNEDMYSKIHNCIITKKLSSSSLVKFVIKQLE